LPPVGGIAIYEHFEIILHPMRLQVDTRMGSKLMEYVWPERRRRKQLDSPHSPTSEARPRRITEAAPAPRNLPGQRTSMDSPRTPEAGKSLDVGRSIDTAALAPPQLRRMATSRSFTDLRSAMKEQEHAPKLNRGFSFAQPPTPAAEVGANGHGKPHAHGDAEEMKSRSSQKTFVLVRVPRLANNELIHYNSLSLLLSVWKEGSFLCQDARIQTRDLEFKNQTWSVRALLCL
jgi:hypothetical protein